MIISLSMNKPARIEDLRPGVKVIDSTSGPCVCTGRPTYCAGGYGVDVVGTLWNGEPIRWTACVVNLTLVSQ